MRVVTLGETMALVRTRDVGSLRHATDLVLGIGGAESNVAIGLRRLGVDVSWLGRVGDDSLGERVLREVRAEGVDVRGVVDPHAPTALMVKERPTPTSTWVGYYRVAAAGSHLSRDDIPPGWIEQAQIMHVTGITPLLSPSAHDAVVAAIDRAHAAGVRVSFDINYRSALGAAEHAGPLLRTLAQNADMVFGGGDELELLYPGLDPLEAARELCSGVPREVVWKRGADGACAVRPGEIVEVQGLVVDVVDTVGAGDAFVAGYLSAALEGLDTEARLRRGNICGALACTAAGDWESSPTRRDLDRFGARAADPVAR
ncbi:sugar kinase [Microbacterium horticulturae]|uniref:Sugar kinase n=1 Tax=Microbacterium horticulturae TaxID=3028316 RepID=A0ABY8BZ94_9MICO|nr:sugar kinase [Microbacterium sp. KACC 23027]WEG08792.1 sugar kinase [Microbacterium sp. KACC 23027]